MMFRKSVQMIAVPFDLLRRESAFRQTHGIVVACTRLAKATTPYVADEQHGAKVHRFLQRV
jgi:hypothetical protein